MDNRFILSQVLLIQTLAWSQPPIIPQWEAINPQKRVLQKGDQLEIHLVSLPDTEKKYTVRADGTFFHPLAGEIQASGKTLQQVEAILAQRLKRELRNPAFRIGLTSLADAEAAVMGEVRSQGKFKFAAGTSVMDLLAQAGGLSEKADKDSAIIWREGKEIEINLNPAGLNELSRMQVRNGDILYVNRGKRVGVSGEVQAKGIYSVSTKSVNSVEDAVKAAGGATESAALSRVQIIRPSLAAPILVNLLDPAEAGKIILQDGDTVLVPARRAVILGAVGKQGILPLNGSESLVDVVSQAGVSQGNLAAVVVIRAADVQASTDKKEIYNLEGNFQEGQQTVRVPIQDGDVVFVPPKAENNLLTGGSSLMQMLFMARSLFSI